MGVPQATAQREAGLAAPACSLGNTAQADSTGSQDTLCLPGLGLWFHSRECSGPASRGAAKSFPLKENHKLEQDFSAEQWGTHLYSGHQVTLLAYFVLWLQ